MDCEKRPMPRSNALLAVCLLMTGCGVELRTPPAATTVTVSATTQIQDRPPPVLPPPPVDPLVLAPGQTVVTLTFDDGWASDARAAQILNAAGLRGTFFINSGTIGTPDFLTLAELDWIATSSGNEIAGYTITKPRLDSLTPAQIRHEICDDRATLMKWGFPVRNFAYPFGYVTPEIEQTVASCGYNSARAVVETFGEQGTVETVPPTDPFRTASSEQGGDLSAMADLQRAVTPESGGWVQLTFHAITAIPAFTDFVLWLADQQAQGRLVVRTVGEVIGGAVQPAPEVHP